MPHDPMVNEFDMPAPRWIRSYPCGPYRFLNREFFIITYETDRDILESILPPGLELIAPHVKFEFIRMPDSTGFGDYTESGQVIPVRFKGEEGGFTVAMFLDDFPPIAGGREIWGYPKKLAKPKLVVEADTLLGTLDYGSVRIATGTMGYKHHEVDQKAILESCQQPVFLLKNIPGVDGKPQINQLTKTYLQDIVIKGAWTGPASLELHPHALAPVADLPVRKIVSAVHFISDLTLPYGEVAEDYLAKK
ncbi:MAG: acetoacetate decarboxylase [Legionella sp.]